MLEVKTTSQWRCIPDVAKTSSMPRNVRRQFTYLESQVTVPLLCH